MSSIALTTLIRAESPTLGPMQLAPGSSTSTGQEARSCAAAAYTLRVAVRRQACVHLVLRGLSTLNWGSKTFHAVWARTYDAKLVSPTRAQQQASAISQQPRKA